ncbi:MAG TPA: hypothetical protein VJ861_12085 [Treponemataceae bacterium]|nr:hypothetical protein [Treponemataceae bacterium]
MKRIEIIFNQSLEEDVLLALKPFPEAQFFTMIPGVHGQGYSTPKQGDAIWPEENSLMIIYCNSDEVAHNIQKAIKKVQDVYKDEGIAFFMM